MINKYDLTIPLSDSIYEFCRTADIPVKGEIPYDESVRGRSGWESRLPNMNHLQQKPFIVSGIT